MNVVIFEKCAICVDKVTYVAKDYSSNNYSLLVCFDNTTTPVSFNFPDVEQLDLAFEDFKKAMQS